MVLWQMFLSRACALDNISQGYLTPETISEAPASFGNYGGSYFIPDFARNSNDTSLWKIFVMPRDGGNPTVFATNPNNSMLGGIFLPSTGWGANSGNYVTVGRSTNEYLPSAPYLLGEVYTYNAAGITSKLAEIPGASLTQPRIAPNNFGAYAGNLIVADSYNVAAGGTPTMDRVIAVNPAGGYTVIANLPKVTSGAWGLTFAPSGFGAGRRQPSDQRSGPVEPSPC